MPDSFIFTSDSVTEGHPDKLCDQVSDAVVDAYLAADPLSAVIAECALAKGVMFLSVRFGSQARVDAPAVAREVIQHAGYDGDVGFNADACSVLTSLSELPGGATADETALDGEAFDRLPANEQVTLFGYACDHTPTLLPLPVALAHRLARRLGEARRQRALPYLAPDGKTQVSVEFRDRRPARIRAVAVVTATQPGQYPGGARLRDDLIQGVVEPAFEGAPLAPDGDTVYLVNPAGPVEGGGPDLHSGLTGRKTGIDTYGEFARHSGAALSGKGPDRIDRAGAYAARHAAKCVVAAGLARECEMQLSYMIGLSKPVSVEVSTFGTGSEADDALARRVAAAFDFRPAAVVARFRLRHLPGEHGGSYYQRLATFGHMGRDDPPPPWEDTAAADALR